MNTKNILSVAIASTTLFTIVAFTGLQQKKEKKEGKGNHRQEQSSDEGKGGKQKQDKHHDREDKGDKRDDKHWKKNEAGEKYKHGNKHEDKGNWNKADNDDYSYKSKKKYGNGNSYKMNGKRDKDIDWNLNEFENRKHPKNQKKVSICHKPGEGENNGVTINVSENALKAHMNHGDRMGNCADNSSRWSSDYVKARENVFNTYEQTWERMSYSEALLRLAADKLLGIKTNLDRTRLTLSNEELQRKEALILDLQNNINTLDNRLELTEKRLDSDVNIIIKL